MNRKRKKTVNKGPALDGRIGLPHTFDPINTSWKPTIYGAVLESRWCRDEWNEAIVSKKFTFQRKRGSKEVILQGMMQGLKAKYVPNSIGPSGTQRRPRVFVSRMERWWKRAGEGTVPSEDTEKGMWRLGWGLRRNRIKKYLWLQLTWRIIEPTFILYIRMNDPSYSASIPLPPCSFPSYPFLSPLLSQSETFPLLPIPSLSFSALTLFISQDFIFLPLPLSRIEMRWESKLQVEELPSRR